jgi:hypothetical protein
MATIYTIQSDCPKVPYYNDKEMDLAMRFFLEKGFLIVPESNFRKIFFEKNMCYINDAINPAEYFYNVDLHMDLDKFENFYGSNTYSDYQKSFEMSSYSECVFAYMKNLLCFNLDSEQDLTEILNRRSPVAIALRGYLDFVILDKNGFKFVKVGKKSIQRKKTQTKLVKKAFGCTHGQMTINVEVNYSKFSFEHIIENIELEKSTKILHDERFNTMRPSWVDPISKKPSFIEEAALSYYKKIGFRGSVDHNSESAPFEVLLDCIYSKPLFVGKEEYQKFNDKYDSDQLYTQDRLIEEIKSLERCNDDNLSSLIKELKSQIVFIPDDIEEQRYKVNLKHHLALIAEKKEYIENCQSKIASITEDIIKQNYKSRHAKSPISLETIIQIFRCMGRDNFSKAITLMSGGASNGFPDLIVCKDNKIEFIEVKSPTDKLNFNQKHFAQYVLEPLGYKLKVARVILSKDVEDVI